MVRGTFSLKSCIVGYHQLSHNSGNPAEQALTAAALGNAAQNMSSLSMYAGEINAAATGGNFPQNFPHLKRTSMCRHQIPL